MPSHNPPMDIAIFLLARCAGAKKYFSVIDDAYARRDEIEQMAVAGQGKDALIAMGKKFGVPAAKVETCIGDQAGAQRIIDGAQAGMRDFKVTGTPAIIVNGETLPGFGLDEISAKIDEQLKAAGK
jgi:protein-disulfide isomerase